MTDSILLFPSEASGQKSLSDKKAGRSAGRSEINDLDLSDWKSLSQILTDSLWVIPERDKSGAHSAEYHGNFIPQIPRQMMLRYTKKGDVVLDGFLGSGTTLIECRRLGRHGIGVELIPEVARKARMAVSREKNVGEVHTLVIESDARQPDTAQKVANGLAELGRQTVQLLILHPPYHDIVKFSKDPRDLCNAPTLREVLDWFSVALKNPSPLSTTCSPN